MEIRDRIRRRREELGLSLEDVARVLGVNRSTVYRYETNEIGRLSVETLGPLAAALHCTPAYLMGLEEKEPSITENYVTFPITGEVAAGYSHAGEADAIQDTVDVPAQYLRGRPASDYFVLRVVGDSMYPDYKSGDLVLVLKTPTLSRSGQIGVVQNGGDATLKKVEYVMGEDWLRLVPLNRDYPEQVVTGPELEEWRVRGIPRLVIREIDD